MSSRYLGPHFDIHCGGVDNMFPHHEDEIAQSEAANGCRFVNVWLHCAHLVVDGKKMSKSLGNFHTLRDVLERGYTGREVRYVLLATHYRQELNFSFRGCDDARTALQRLDACRKRLEDAVRLPDQRVEATREATGRSLAAFRAALEDDLNISAALAVLFDLVRDTNRGLDVGELAGAAATAVLEALRSMDTVLAVLAPDDAEGVPEHILALAGERQAARKAKDFARADRIRDELAAAGWVIEDTPKGPRARRK
jgi:cysteinyl-tRNA synthetase